MVKLKYFFVGLFSIITLSIFLQSVVLAAPKLDAGDTGGDSSCVQRFLTFPTWYRGIVDSQCNIKPPSDPSFGSNPFAGFIWTIALNIVEIILQAAGYAAVFFIIYGGYKYMISAGSSEGIASAKKTITNAVIGLVISIAAVAIVNTIVNAF